MQAQIFWELFLGNQSGVFRGRFEMLQTNYG